MFVNNYIQWFLCTVIKFQVVNESYMHMYIQSSSSSTFITNFNLFVMMHMPFQYNNDKSGKMDIIQCHIVNSVAVLLIEVFNKL